MLAQQDLLLKAPIIQHYNQLQSNEGVLTLDAIKQIENSGKLVSFKELKLKTAKLINHADLGSDKDLTLHIPTIENTKRISAKGKLDLHVAILTNRGEILGGIGDNLIEVKKLLTNYNKIATAGPLTIQGPGADLVNHCELTANEKLTIKASNLSNTHLIQGNILTKLTITGEILNRGTIASVKDLDIQADRISDTIKQSEDYHSQLFTGWSWLTSKKDHRSTKLRAGSDPYEKGFEEQIRTTKEPLKYRRTILANGIIRLQAEELQGNDILAGRGDKEGVASTITLTKHQAIEQNNVISSAGNLEINLSQNQALHNYNQITAANKLTIQGGEEVYNHARAHIQGAIVRVEFNREGYGSQRIVNEGTFMGLQELHLTVPRGDVVNEARLQAGTLLHINTGEFSNKPGASTLSGGVMTIQARRIKNDQGEIFAAGTTDTPGKITLEGQNVGYAEEVINITGDQKARIEAIGDITIKAKKLENKGNVTSCDYDIDTQYPNTNLGPYASDNWVEVSTTYGRYWFNSGRLHGDTDYNFYEIERREPISKIRTSLAHINAQVTLTLVGISEINNYGSELTAGDKLIITNANETFSSFQVALSQGDNTINGTHIKNITPSRSVYISDAHKYDKSWRNWGCSLWRVYRASESFTIESADKALIRGGSETIINTKTLDNGIKVPEGKVDTLANPLDKLEGNGLLKFDDSQLPEGKHGLFTLQVDTTVSVDNDPIETPQIKASQFELPTLAQSGFTPIEIQVDQELAKELAPAHYTAKDIQQAIASYVPTTTTEKLAALPVSSTDISFQATKRQALAPESDASYDPFAHYTAVDIQQAITPYVSQATIEQLAALSTVSNTTSRTHAVHSGQPLLGESATSHDLPIGTIHQEEKRQLASDHIDHQPAPPIEEVKFTCLPPLVRSTLPVDQSKFYGSPYFLRHVGLDPGQRGTPANPLRFLGDPFYESGIISDAIQKATARALLYEDVVTPEEQIKVLIDNTAEIAKDLKVGLGVALSKEQINNLKKDILWYEEKTVKGQQVLVPQVYLTKETISSLRSKPTGGIRSGGKMSLHVQEKLTNTGTISAKDEVILRAQSLHNESFGDTQATIQSTKGALDLQTKKNIDNISGKITGATATKVVSTEGAIHNTTKLLDESTLHMQASIESGGDLTMQAKEDIVNTAAKLKAVGDAIIQSETGDVKFLTQKTKTTKITHSASHDNGFFSSSHSSNTTIHTKTEHAVSELEIGGNATIKGRDITFMGTKAQVGQDMNLDASRDINALAVQDIEETATTSVEHKEESGLFGSKSTTKTHSSTHRESTSKGIDFKVGGTLGAKADGNADFEGAHVTAKNVKIDVKGETTIRNAYDETSHEERSSVDNKDEALGGLFKDNNGKKTHSKTFDKKATGNTWKIAEKFEIVGEGDVTTQAIKLEAHQFKIESTKGNVYDKAAEEVHEKGQEVHTYSERQGLLFGKKDDVQWKGEEGRVSIKLREKKEETTQIKDNNTSAHSSSFKTHAKVVETADGKQELIQGNGTFKAAKKVELEATETDIQGKLSLQGKEGVSILAKKETDCHEEHHCNSIHHG